MPRFSALVGFGSFPPIVFFMLTKTSEFMFISLHVHVHVHISTKQYRRGGKRGGIVSDITFENSDARLVRAGMTTWGRGLVRLGTVNVILFRSGSVIWVCFFIRNRLLYECVDTYPIRRLREGLRTC
jgi:hypothetical protein